MFKKFIKIVLLIVLSLSLSTMYTVGADASTKVMWGKTELKVGQVGKVTVLGNIKLYQLSDNREVLATVRTLKKGEEFRVYSVRDIAVDNYSAYYAVGGNNYIKTTDNVKYETPSKSKLALLKGQGSNTTAESQQKNTTKNSNTKRDINFNMSVSQVEKSESATLLSKVTDGKLTEIKYETKKFGYYADLSYIFENGVLNYIVYDFLPDQESYDTWNQMISIHGNLHDGAVGELGTDYTYTSDKYTSLYTSWSKRDYDILLMVHDKNLYTTAQLVYYRK